MLLAYFYIRCAHYGHNMTYIRTKKRKGKSGILTYYYLVEGKRSDGKTKQKVLKYYGTTLPPKDIEIDSDTVGTVTQILINTRPSSTKLKEQLQEFDITPPDEEIKGISIVYNPPLKKFFLHINSA